MTLPAGVITTTIHYGAPVTFMGDHVSMTVIVAPTVDLIWAATGQPVIAFTQTVTSDEGASGSFVLPVTDQDGFVNHAGEPVTGWAYKVTIHYRDNTRQSKNATKTIAPLTGQTDVDLDLIPTVPGSAALTGTVPTVLSVNGETGNVTIAGGGGLVESPDHPGLYTIGA